MSCICQYFVHSKDSTTNPSLTSDSANSERGYSGDLRQDKEDKSIGSNISATDTASSCAEIWILKKNLSEARVSIENLENLVKTIIEKQNVMLTEMYQLKRTNFELQEECRMQRDYHTMERNAMMRELHDVKMLLSNRSKILEETVQKNTELMNSVEDANEKIYLMGMKYFKLKNSHCDEKSLSSYSGSSEPESDASAESENSDQSD